MKRSIILTLLVLWLAPVADALATDITLTWVAPTTYTTADTIPAGTAITYKVWGAVQGATKTLLITVATTTTVRTNVNPGIQCYQVSALVAGVESVPGNEACATVVAPLPKPSPPTSLTSVAK